jgi:hypothetical protein
LTYIVVPTGKKDNANESVYIDAKLYTHEKTYEWKTKTIKEHNGVSNFFYFPDAGIIAFMKDPMFDQSVEWSFSDDDLIFLKYV